MYHVKYEAVVCDQRTGEELNEILDRAFESFALAQVFVSQLMDQYPEFLDLMRISIVRM